MREERAIVPRDVGGGLRRVLARVLHKLQPSRMRYVRNALVGAILIYRYLFNVQYLGH